MLRVAEPMMSSMRDEAERSLRRRRKYSSGSVMRQRPKQSTAM
jgi:hypothetical protein